MSPNSTMKDEVRETMKKEYDFSNARKTCMLTGYSFVMKR